MPLIWLETDSEAKKNPFNRLHQEGACAQILEVTARSPMYGSLPNYEMTGAQKLTEHAQRRMTGNTDWHEVHFSQLRRWFESQEGHIMKVACWSYISLNPFPPIQPIPVNICDPTISGCSSVCFFYVLSSPTRHRYWHKKSFSIPRCLVCYYSSSIWTGVAFGLSVTQVTIQLSGFIVPFVRPSVLAAPPRYWLDKSGRIFTGNATTSIQDYCAFCDCRPLGDLCDRLDEFRVPQPRSLRPFRKPLRKLNRLWCKSSGPVESVNSDEWTQCKTWAVSSERAIWNERSVILKFSSNNTDRLCS